MSIFSAENMALCTLFVPGDLLNLDVNFQAGPEERDIKGTFYVPFSWHCPGHL